MKDVMVDIETLGKTPGCAVLSIGAVVFNPLSFDTGNKFYININPEDAAREGFFSDPSTVEWWSKQSQEAKDHLTPDQHSVREALGRFIEFFKSNNLEKIWCHGATFDAPILEHALKFLNMSVPWKYYDVRDTRTVFDLFQMDIREEKREGTYHNALDDAMFQTVCIQKALAPRG